MTTTTNKVTVIANKVESLRTKSQSLRTKSQSLRTKSSHCKQNRSHCEQSEAIYNILHFINAFNGIRAPLKTRLPRFARNDQAPSLRDFEEVVAV